MFIRSKGERESRYTHDSPIPPTLGSGTKPFDEVALPPLLQCLGIHHPCPSDPDGREMRHGIARIGSVGLALCVSFEPNLPFANLFPPLVPHALRIGLDG